jgi:hypothetical protein
MYLHIVYLSWCISKAIYLEKSKLIVILGRENSEYAIINSSS